MLGTLRPIFRDGEQAGFQHHHKQFKLWIVIDALSMQDDMIHCTSASAATRPFVLI